MHSALGMPPRNGCTLRELLDSDIVQALRKLVQLEDISEIVEWRVTAGNAAVVPRLQPPDFSARSKCPARSCFARR
jgi:hypothetical protein